MTKITNIKLIKGFEYEITFDNGMVEKARLAGTHLSETEKRFGTVGILRFNFENEITETKIKDVDKENKYDK